MNNSKTPHHPWRNISREFASHVAMLRPPERQLIKTEEQQFLTAREALFSPQVQAARDYAESMMGLREKIDDDELMC